MVTLIISPSFIMEPTVGKSPISWNLWAIGRQLIELVGRLKQGPFDTSLVWIEFGANCSGQTKDFIEEGERRLVSDFTQNTTNQNAENVLQILKKEGLDPSPENFAVFFHYLAGDTPNLNMSLDLLRQRFGKISDSQCQELYQAHLGLDHERRELQKSSQLIEEELLQLMRVLDESSAEANAYDKSLTHFSGAIEKTTALPQSTPAMDMIRAALARVAQETRSMAEQSQRLQNQLAKSTEQLTEVRYNLDQAQHESLIDALTEIGNRKFFNRELVRITRDAREMGTPLTILMADIDHFKKFNDTYGHLIGDQVLRLVARTLVENLKGRDIIARYGGEEFVILLPDTRVDDGERVANLLRNVLATKQIQRKKTGETLGIVTISIGVAEYHKGEDLTGFVGRVDEALYEAKHQGRNRAIAKILTPAEVAQLPQQDPNSPWPPQDMTEPTDIQS